jgi:hypothetical protein
MLRLDGLPRLVSKSEVQPPTPLQLGVSDVVVPFLLSHCVPDSVTLLVPPDVVGLGQQEEDNAEDVDANQRAVSSPVLRLVVIQVDKIGDDVPQLYIHLDKSKSQLKDQSHVVLGRKLTLYTAADTERVPTLFAFLEVQATRMASVEATFSENKYTGLRLELR